jgi:hypothetical protein
MKEGENDDYSRRVIIIMLLARTTKDYARDTRLIEL